jgi:trehalose 6-phosphate synthase/phosphatase
MKLSIQPSRSASSAVPLRATARLLVVSHRLPIALDREGRGERGRSSRWTARRDGGVLTRALAPVLQERGGVWIGWPGVAEEQVPGLKRVLAGAIESGGYPLRPVSLGVEELRQGSQRFAGEALWPLFHGDPSGCRSDSAGFLGYARMNRRFARAVARVAGPADLVWVHDHHLMTVAAELARMGAPGGRPHCAFFLHIPFPAPDLFWRLPWRRTLLESLLAYDFLGFQTPRDLANFLASVERMGGTAIHRVRAGAFPIGIDAAEVEARAAAPEVTAQAAAIRRSLDGRRIVLGLDRLDAAQGVREKLRAFAHLLSQHPELSGRVTFLEIVEPGHDRSPRQEEEQTAIERLVGEINGRFGTPGWIPVHYRLRSLGRDETLACYRAAELALFTPLAEGMSLAAKEYCAVGDGALVLSEFSGAALQMAGPQGALAVNPHDREATAEAIARALAMDAGERAARTSRLRRGVHRQDVAWWVGSFLAGATADRGISERLRARPVAESRV